MKKSELRRIVKEEIQKFSLNEAFNLKNPKTADEAREQAMDWQSEFSNKSTSWEDVIKAANHFEKMAKKFNLTKEFRENGII